MWKSCRSSLTNIRQNKDNGEPYMIQYNENTKTFRLDTEKSTYVIAVAAEGYLFHSYWGAKISDEELGYLQPWTANASFSASIPGGGYTLDTRLQEYPANGTGDFRISAVSLRGKSGNSATTLKYVSHEIFDGKKGLPGLPAAYGEEADCQTLEITMEDSLWRSVVVLSYSVFPQYDAIARSARIVNKSVNDIEIERAMSAGFDFWRNDFDFVHLYGAWAKERQLERYPLHHGYQSIASKRGSSSHNHTPFVALAQSGSGEENGDVYGFTMLYSGNFAMECEVDTFGNTRLLCGINPDVRFVEKPVEALSLDDFPVSEVSDQPDLSELSSLSDLPNLPDSGFEQAGDSGVKIPVLSPEVNRQSSFSIRDLDAPKKLEFSKSKKEDVLYTWHWRLPEALTEEQYAAVLAALRDTDHLALWRAKGFVKTLDGVQHKIDYVFGDLFSEEFKGEVPETESGIVLIGRKIDRRFLGEVLSSAENGKTGTSGD